MLPTSNNLSHMIYFKNVVDVAFLKNDLHQQFCLKIHFTFSFFILSLCVSKMKEEDGWWLLYVKKDKQLKKKSIFK